MAHVTRVVGRLEADEEAVTGGHHLFAVVRSEQAAQGLVVPAEQALPRLVAE